VLGGLRIDFGEECDFSDGWRTTNFLGLAEQKHSVMLAISPSRIRILAG